MKKPYTTAIILAGGSGTRLGSATPKQLLPILGQPMLSHTLRSFLSSALVDAFVVVSRSRDMETVRHMAEKIILGKPLFFAEGGETRMDSVLAGIKALPPQTEFVAIHDGARCLIHPQDIDAVIEVAHQKGSATLVKPLSDTLKKKDPTGDIVDTLDRDTLCLAQTPQVFRKADYIAAAEQAKASGLAVTDDNRLFECLGKAVPCVISLHENEKITYQKDLSYAEFILTQRQKKGREKTMRIGHGYDVHRLKEGRALIVGGVTIPYEKGLDGHSDADVLVHAIMDALLGAAGLPDIGNLFPDSKAEFKDISSLLLLDRVGKALAEKGFGIGNIDATVIAQAPKMAPHIREMRQKIAATLGCSEDVVNVKATTEEKLGFTGAGEGIAAHAVCLIEQ